MSQSVSNRRFAYRSGPMRAMLGSLVVLGAIFWVSPATAAEPLQGPDRPLNLEEMLTKARRDGKYEMLLRQIKVPADKARYGDFRDHGFRNLTEYGKFSNLPAGYWVYVAPYWYIWRDLANVAKVKRSYGPEQATGPPDTAEAGDAATAWASLTADGQEEWLMLEYAEPFVPNAVSVYENVAPGALFRVTVFNLEGDEIEVWKGKDPTSADKEKGISVVPIKVKFKTNRIKIYLDSINVPYWNEIDAVGLRDSATGKVHWAKAAEASTTYASPAQVPAADSKLAERVMALETEVRELKETLQEIKEMLKKKLK